MTQAQVEVGGLAVELNGINVIAENERKGKPSDLFWPWCAANISVLAISYGSFVVGFGLSFWQATIAGVVGVVLSFALCGVVALAGKRGSAPTMVLSRAAFGVTGNALPAALSWILLVGWETVLVSLSALATSTVFTELGWGGGTLTKIVAFFVTAALVVGGGVLGFDVIMRMQTYITVATAVLTVGFVALTVDEIDWSKISDAKSGSLQAFVGGLALVTTGFGVGWANTAADYSRYLPRRSSSRGVFGWTTLGGAAAPLVLHAAAHVVSRAVRDRRRARSRRWRCARHLLLRPRVADPRPEDSALCRGRRGRRDHGARIHLRRVHCRRLHRALPGLPDHGRRADRCLGRRVRRRPGVAAQRLRRPRAL